MPGASRIRWGVVATGNIAGVFTKDLRHLDDHEVVAVGSRNLERAQGFAEEHKAHGHSGIKAYGSYHEVADDPNVDAVYVATPHSDHYETTRYALEAGKAVLVEKAFTVNAAEARDLIHRATAKGLFLMEAMWMRTNPLHLLLKRKVQEGVIGEPSTLRAELGFVAPYAPDARLFAPELAGGALLDVGVYPVSLAYHLFGIPSEVSAVQLPAPTPVDGTFAAVFSYGKNKLATLTGSLITELPNTAAIGGTEGWIELPRSFHDARHFTLHRKGRDPKVFRIDLRGAGYTYEAEEVSRGLRSGAIESPLVTHADTLAVMELLDEIRNQIGLRYPREKEEESANPRQRID